MLKKLFALFLLAAMATAHAVPIPPPTAIAPDPILHFTDNNGNPAVGYQLFIYAAGTTTPTTTYTSASGTGTNTNPIILNSRGEANVWLTPGAGYKFVFTTPTDTNPPTSPIWTVDNVYGNSPTSGGSGVSLLFYGGLCNGVFDNKTAFANAMASGNALITLPPGGNCYTTGSVVVPNGVTLDGQAMTPGAQNSSGSQVPLGSTITCATSVTNCVQLDNASGGTETIRNVIITRPSVSVTANNVGLYVDAAYNVQIQNVFVLNNDYNYSFFDNSGSGLCGGISAKVVNSFSGNAKTAHIFINDWPELFWDGGRIGMNGGGDLYAADYTRLTGTSTGACGGQGPNGIRFTGVQFNQGNSLIPAGWCWNFVGMNIPSGNAVEYSAVNSHYENAAGFLQTDSSTPYVGRLQLTNDTINLTTPFLNLNAATQVYQWGITNNHIFCSTFVLGSNTTMSGMAITGNPAINCAVTLNGPGAGATMIFANNVLGGAASITGTWGALYWIANPSTSGSLTNSSTSAGVYVVPFANVATFTPGLAFNGSSTGVTCSSCLGWYTQTGHVITAFFQIALSSISGAGICTGGSCNATITGLPASGPYSSAAGGAITQASNMTGLTGPMLLQVPASVTYANLDQTTSAGLSQVFIANFTNTSIIYGLVSYHE